MGIKIAYLGLGPLQFLVYRSIIFKLKMTAVEMILNYRSYCDTTSRQYSDMIKEKRVVTSTFNYLVTSPVQDGIDRIFNIGKSFNTTLVYKIIHVSFLDHLCILTNLSVLNNQALRYYYLPCGTLFLPCGALCPPCGTLCLQCGTLCTLWYLAVFSSTHSYSLQ